MKTIALRFSDNFAPECGTIKAHEDVIQQYGFVWYGKMGTKIATVVVEELLKEADPRILLIHSGKTGRYWAHITAAQSEQPDPEKIPEYYRDDTGKFHYWFKVVRFEEAEKDVMMKCIVPSSGNTLSKASKYSMSPYFRIEYNTEE